MKLRPVLLSAGAAIAIASAITWYFARPESVVAVAPKTGDAAEIIYATGVVEPLTWAKVTPLVRERIIEQCDCEGAVVEGGFVLARLDTGEAEAELAELRARLKLAVEEQERVSVLVNRNVGTQQALDRARAEVAQIDAMIAGQKARLENYLLRAPSSGVVLRQNGEVGEIAEQGSVLFWVGQLRPLVVIADVNEEDIPRVSTGQKALLQSDAFPNQVLRATVQRITPMGDPVSRTYRVRLLLPDDTPLLIGMSVDVNIVVRTSMDVLLVPAPAVQGNSLFVIESGRARRRTVDVGIRGAREVEIRSGIEASTDAIISPFPDGLTDGARVKVTER